MNKTFNLDFAITDLKKTFVDGMLNVTLNKDNHTEMCVNSTQQQLDRVGWH